MRMNEKVSKILFIYLFWSGFSAWMEGKPTTTAI